MAPRALPTVLSPRTVERVQNTIREVFVSATAKDLGEYRTNVREALRLVQADVFLQEEWAEATKNVVDLCLARLADSDAYLGLFGFRYGWVPPGRTQSITELEYVHAARIWQESPKPAPIFLFMPEAGSTAAEELSRLADEELAREHTDPALRAQSRDRQKAMCQQLATSGVFIRSFTSVTHLRELAIASVSNFNKTILLNAKDARRSAMPEIPRDALGELGRGGQVADIEERQANLEASTAAGMCLVVHGSQQAGQFNFLKFLEIWDGWGLQASRTLFITPPHDEFDEGSLRAAIASTLGVRDLADPSFADVATSVLAHCAKEPLVLLLPRGPRGGLSEFQRAFWQPLCQALAAQAGAKPPKGRLILVITSLEPLVDGFDYVQSADAGQANFRLLQPVPELGNFKAADVSTWLKNQGMTDIARRTQIAQQVVKLDGIPFNVFERLVANGFWATLG